MPKAQKAGFPTYWTQFGQGPRDALMIHCSLAHSGSWGGLARHLSGALTMTAFDLPGHGRSADWDDRAEIQGLCVDIASEFLQKPADIIGHSFGATVALRLAVSRPDLVRSLTLIEPVFFAVAFHDHPSGRAAFEARMADFNAAMQAGDFLSAARAFLSVWGDRADWEQLPETVRTGLAAQMPVVAAGQPALHTDLAGLLEPGILQGLDLPVLLCEGSESPAIMAQITEGLAARLPRAERAVVAGAAHMAPISHAQQISAEMLRFLLSC